MLNQTFDRYRSGDSLIHHLDPRVKVVVTFLFVLSTVMLPDGEHFGPLEQPARLVELLRDFLSPSSKPAEERERGGAAAGEDYSPGLWSLGLGRLGGK